MDLAVVGVAAVGTTDNGTFKGIRISLGAVASTPVRAKLSEAILEGQLISSSIIEKAADQAALESKPIDDHRASAEYRRDMVRVLTRRALEQIYAAEL
jgi:carbon-monoxide dehydrogenase medium subunit